MSKLPVIKPREVVKFLEHEGFSLKRSKGSHLRYHHSDRRKVTIAFHNKPLKKGTLKSILRQSELSTNDLLAFLKKK